MKGAKTVNDTVTQEGPHFGPFQVMRLMDDGAMGEVYEAEDIREHRAVALKLIPQEFADDAMFRVRMHREADAAGQPPEPHLVPIHDYGDVDGQFYVATPMIDGTSLRTLLTDYGLLSPARAVAIVRQVAAALDSAHNRGVNYHDVKPENIVVSHDYDAYLLDFGIADALSDLMPAEDETAVGTYNYMAPEWFSGDEVTNRADIYALACVLSECLTGEPPYRADSVEQLIAAQLHGNVARPSQLRPGWVSPDFDSVVAKGIAHDAAERYRTAGELAAATHAALTTADQQPDEDGLDQDGLDQDNTARRVDAETLLPNAVAADLVSDEGSWGNGHSTVAPAAPQPQYFDEAELEGRWRNQPSFESMFDQALLTMPPRRDNRRLLVVIGAVALVAVVVIVIAGFLIFTPSSPPPTKPATAQQAGRQTVLPFNGLNFRLSPGGVAVDNTGTVYVTNQGMYGRVVALSAGSSSPTVEPFRGLYEPQGVAVDGAGTLYVTDFNNRVVMLAAGSSSQIELPFQGLSYPEGVAVDSQGGVYVADRGNNRVVKLAAGSNDQVVLPFDGLNNPDGVAIDNAGNVYVTDTDNSRVLRFNIASNDQTVLPFPRLDRPWGIAVDRTGDVIVTEHDTNTVVRWAAGSPATAVLPFSGLNTPLSVTVDKSGNIYVADRGDDSVVKLAPS